MKYADTRETIKTGDLLAWSHDGIDSWHDFEVQMVRVGTKSEFTHVGVACVMAGRVFVIEAVSTGVRLFPLSRVLPFYIVRIPKPLSESALEFAFTHIGLEYESKIQMVIAFLTGKSLSGNQRFQCSELAREIYKADGRLFECPDTPSAVVHCAMENWGPLEFVV